MLRLGLRDGVYTEWCEAYGYKEPNLDIRTLQSMLAAALAVRVVGGLLHPSIRSTKLFADQQLVISWRRGARWCKVSVVEPFHMGLRFCFCSIAVGDRGREIVTATKLFGESVVGSVQRRGSQSLMVFYRLPQLSLMLLRRRAF